MEQELLQRIARILHGARMAALGTIKDSGPFVSLVPTVLSPDFQNAWLHLSTLAFHTRHIQDDPRVSLMFWEAAPPEANPQTIPRVTLTGTAERLADDDPLAETARREYLERIPEAEQTFALGDFAMFRVAVDGGRFVGGFAMARTLGPNHLRDASRMKV